MTLSMSQPVVMWSSRLSRDFSLGGGSPTALSQAAVSTDKRNDLQACTSPPRNLLGDTGQAPRQTSLGRGRRFMSRPGAGAFGLHRARKFAHLQALQRLCNHSVVHALLHQLVQAVLQLWVLRDQRLHLHAHSDITPVLPTLCLVATATIPTSTPVRMLSTSTSPGGFLHKLRLTTLKCKLLCFNSWRVLWPSPAS